MSEGNNSYWFVRLKEVNHDEYQGNVNLVDEVFIAEDRDKAKEYCIEKYGKYPFRKTKNFSNGDKYFYLTDSNEYWWDYHNKEVTFICVHCEKKVTVKGEKNSHRFCSDECREADYQIRYAEKYGEGGWVDKDDHLEDKNGLPFGYIYKITNKNTMMCYVGQTRNVPIFRWWQHLKESSDKFGQDSISDLVFEVIDVVYRTDIKRKQVVEDYMKIFNDQYVEERQIEEKLKSELNFREAKWIEHYDSVEHGYNTVQPNTFQQQALEV
jgi:endogenous inhibitor of DNA gyrase (YacG/DUF329 family)